MAVNANAAAVQKSVIINGDIYLPLRPHKNPNRKAAPNVRIAIDMITMNIVFHPRACR
jgi:hypothetical protein